MKKIISFFYFLILIITISYRAKAQNGSPESAAFPVTSDAYRGTINGGCDGFLVKFSSDGKNLLYSTFIGGKDWDICSGMALLPGRRVWLAGNTFSGRFPMTVNTQDDSYNKNGDLFLTLFDLERSKIIWSTFIGGGNEDRCEAFTFVSGESPLLAGRTRSDNYKTTVNAPDRRYSGKKSRRRKISRWDGFLSYVKR